MQKRRDFIAGLSAWPIAHTLSSSLTGAPIPPFAWPAGKRAAVSLTFDDARLSQIDTGRELFQKLGAKATFYVSLGAMRKRLDGWKQMLADGHEVGNHSLSHPCTANYNFSTPLEGLTTAQMEAELDQANAQIKQELGITPVSFAYPCGQKFYGRGVNAKSYIPLVAKRFQSGRGYLDEMANIPAFCDLAALMGTGFDGLTFAQMKVHLDRAAKEGRWVVFAGHEIGASAHQTTDVAALTELVAYLKDPANGFWLAPVREIAAHVKARQPAKP